MSIPMHTDHAPPKDAAIESRREAEIKRHMIQAEKARINYEHAGDDYARLASRELEMEADRAGQKYDAVRRIIQLTNELTSKPHSASSAESQVTLDHEYRAYLRAQSEVVQAKNEAYTRMQSARMQQEHALVAVRVLGRLS